jgi:hypothetical protein
MEGAGLVKFEHLCDRNTGTASVYECTDTAIVAILMVRDGLKRSLSKEPA